jgi:hypothetical protein
VVEGGGYVSKRSKPALIDLGDDSQADLLVAHEVAELVAVDEVDGSVSLLRRPCGRRERIRRR